MLSRILVVLLLMVSGAWPDPIDGQQAAIFQARDKVYPALVHIQPVIRNYSTGELEKQAVVGSGVIFHRDGYVVTNYHVAGKAERIICTLYDRELVPAEYVGGDPSTDLAVIKLNFEDHPGTIPVAEFGDSDLLQVGQYVLAMGSPLSLSRSVSAGVISTLDRYFSHEVRLPTGERTGRYNLWIQTDAAINPGNSGGPLVDMSGRIIGINSRATLFANNIGFAIPVNVVKQVTAAIIADGKVTRSWIGVHCQALQELEGYFGTGRDEGVLIASIDPGSPAEVAFLRAGDIITEVDGEQVSARFVEELPGFYSRIAQKPPGSTLRLKVRREDQDYTFNVVTSQMGQLQGDDFECTGWSFTVKAITRQMQVDHQLEDTLGVYVAGVKRVGSAAEGGLRPGQVITMINNVPIDDLVGFVSQYEALSAADEPRLLMTVRRGGSTRFVLIKIQQGETNDD
ncbi:MAG: trypsin-like peptidase domain-containing protein [bacterium]